VVEMVVRQHDLADRTAGDVPHVRGDCVRLGEGCAAVDQHGPVPANDESHGDVEKR
jgi:hypothetical protein